MADGLRTPVGVVETADGTIYVSNYEGGVLSRVKRDGTVETHSDDFEGLGVGIVADKAGSVYVTDRAAGEIKRVETDGSVTSIMTGLSSPVALGIDTEGHLATATWGDSAFYDIPS